MFRKSISQPQFPSQSSGRGDCGSSESWQWAAPGAAVPCRGGAEAEFDQRRVRLPPFLPTAPSPPTLSFPRPVQQVTRCVRESLFTMKYHLSNFSCQVYLLRTVHMHSELMKCECEIKLKINNKSNDIFTITQRKRMI